MEIYEIRSTVVEGPTSLLISAEVQMNLGLVELQEKLMDRGIDPLKLDNLEELMPILRERVIMSPFTVRDVRLSHASVDGLVVVMDLAIEVEPRYPANELRDKYARLLQTKLETATLERVIAEKQN